MARPTRKPSISRRGYVAGREFVTVTLLVAAGAAGAFVVNGLGIGSRLIEVVSLGLLVGLLLAAALCHLINEFRGSRSGVRDRDYEGRP